MVSVCRSFGEKFVVSWWTESLECRRVRCPESRFVRSAENTINSLTVGGCSKTPPRVLGAKRQICAIAGSRCAMGRSHRLFCVSIDWSRNNRSLLIQHFCAVESTELRYQHGYCHQLRCRLSAIIFGCENELSSQSAAWSTNCAIRYDRRV